MDQKSRTLDFDVKADKYLSAKDQGEDPGSKKSSPEPSRDSDESKKRLEVAHGGAVWQGRSHIVAWGGRGPCKKKKFPIRL